MRRECLEIKDIPYNEGEDTTELVKSVAELAGVEIKAYLSATGYRLEINLGRIVKELSIHLQFPPLSRNLYGKIVLHIT